MTCSVSLLVLTVRAEHVSTSQTKSAAFRIVAPTPKPTPTPMSRTLAVGRTERTSSRVPPLSARDHFRRYPHTPIPSGMKFEARAASRRAA
ncbi:hypothetical protein BZA05DRAFT_412782 [Tricharina praecox]|uniref:uncharacterized protein n=1 Tax=Tricharina praecox TaxID=43433 RepID=UPI00221F48C3|nr:uncharacterized protein BZA05DRAFT_412782 [Tricharina praecox]KAI5841697.1 hypothetical protein BZA05DRAFT_412782 [Tricharina praecox]